MRRCSPIKSRRWQPRARLAAVALFAVLVGASVGCTSRNPGAASDGAGADDAAGRRDAVSDGAALPDLTRDVGAPRDALPGGDLTSDAGPSDGPATAPDKAVPKQCNVDCDCPQGLLCTPSGRCIGAFVAVYCCDKSGCPAGQKCTNKLGQPGVCASPQCQNACDCPQTQGCIQGVCRSGGLAVYCCSQSGCPSGSPCVLPTGQASTCGAATTCGSVCDCQSGEDCVSGLCVATPSPQIFCCRDPACPAGKLCRDASGGFGVCGAAGCKRRCDCPQGQECVGSTCIAIPLATFCCDLPGCPQGQVCLDRKGKQGVCQ